MEARFRAAQRSPCTKAPGDNPDASCRKLDQTSLLRLFDDGDDLAVLDELHLAVLKGEEREVTALADVLAGMNLRAALADDDRAGLEELAVVGLDAEVLRIGIATVTGRCVSSLFSFLLTRLP